MFRWIGRLVESIFAVAGALVFSQAPLFMQYYSQQLSGHVVELHMQIDSMKKVAMQSGKTLEQFIAKFLESSDRDFSSQGELMQGTIDRFNVMSEGYNAFLQATVWDRPFVFMRYLDLEIARTTFSRYTVGIPVTLEGAVYAFAGILLGFIVFYLIKQFFAFLLTPFRRLFTRKPVPPAGQV